MTTMTDEEYLDSLYNAPQEPGYAQIGGRYSVPSPEVQDQTTDSSADSFLNSINPDRQAIKQEAEQTRRPYGYSETETDPRIGVGDLLSAKWNAVREAVVSSDLSPENSNYAIRRAQKYAQDYNELYRKSTSMTALGAGAAEFGATALASLIDPALGLASIGLQTFGESAMGQAEQGKEVDLNRAALAGVGAAGVNAVMPWTRVKMMAPKSAPLKAATDATLLKRTGTALAEDTTTAALEQLAINWGSEKGLTENLGTAALFGAAGGGAVRGGKNIWQGGNNLYAKYQTDGIDGVKKSFESNLPKDLELNPEYKANAIDYGVRSDENAYHLNTLDASSGDEAIKAAAKKTVADSYNGGEYATIDALTMLKHHKFDVTAGAYSAKNKVNLEPGHMDSTVGETVLGMDAGKSSESRKIAEEALISDTKKDSEDIRQGYTSDKHLENNMRAWREIESEFKGTFGRNWDIIDKHFKAGIESGRIPDSKALQSDLTEMKKLLEDLSGYSGSISSAGTADVSYKVANSSERLIELAVKNGVYGKMINEFRDPGKFNPVRTLLNQDQIYRMASAQHPNVKLGIPTQKVTGEVEFSGSDLMTPMTSIPTKTATGFFQKRRAKKGRKALKKDILESRAYGQEVLKEVNQGRMVKAAEMLGKDLDSGDIVDSKPKSARPTKKPTEEQVQETETTEEKAPDVAGEAPAAEAGKGPEPTPEEPKGPTKPEYSVKRPKMPKRTPDKPKDVYAAEMNKYKEDDALINELIGIGSDAEQASRAKFFNEMGGLEGIREAHKKSNKPEDRYFKQFFDKKYKVKMREERDARMEADRESRKQRGSEAETTRKQNEQDRLRTKMEYDIDYHKIPKDVVDDVKVSLKINDVDDITPDQAAMFTKKARRIVDERDNAQKAKEAKELKDAEEAADKAAKAASLENQRDLLNKSLDRIQDGGEAFLKIKKSILAKVGSQRTKPLSEEILGTYLGDIDKAIVGEIKIHRQAYEKSHNQADLDKAIELGKKLEMTKEEMDRMISDAKKHSEANKAAEAKREEIRQEDLKRKKAKADAEEYERSAEAQYARDKAQALGYAGAAGLDVKTHNIFVEKATENGKLDYQKYTKMVDDEMEARAAKAYAEAEERFEGYTKEDLKDVAEDLLKTNKSGHQAIPPELEAEIQALMDKAGKMKDHKTVKILQAYTKAVTNAMRRKNSFPGKKNENLWLSQDDYEELQSAISDRFGGTGGSTNILKSLRTKIYGRSKNRDDMWGDELINQKIQKKKNKMKGKFSEEGKEAPKAEPKAEESVSPDDLGEEFTQPKAEPKPKAEPAAEATPSKSDKDVFDKMEKGRTVVEDAEVVSTPAAESKPKTQTTRTKVQSLPKPEPKAEEPKVEQVTKGALGEIAAPKEAPKYSASAKAVGDVVGKYFKKGRPIKDMNADIEEFKKEAMDVISKNSKGAWPLELESEVNKIVKKRSKADMETQIAKLYKLIMKLQKGE